MRPVIDGMSNTHEDAAPLQRGGSAPRTPGVVFQAVVLLSVAVWVLLPLLWMLSTSFKPPGTELRLPIEYLPQQLTWENYATVLGPRFSFFRSLWNSIFVSTVSMLGTLCLSSMAAFSIARLRFRYRIGSLQLLQLAGMVPPITVIGPTFVMMRAMGLLQTLWGMVIPNLVYGVPVAAFLLAAYMRSLPVELDDAAAIDGAGSARMFFSVILPLSVPALASAGILVFMGSWSEFLLANAISLGSPASQTLPVSIQGFSRAFQLQWAWVSAAVVLSLIPVLILSVLFQRFIVEGITTGATN